MEAGVDWNHVHKAIRHVASGVFMGGGGFTLPVYLSYTVVCSC
jgi:hypothetical protein